jgi:hypothetical protein
MEGLLQTVANQVNVVLPVNTKAVLTLLVEEEPTTVAFTGQPALDLDEVQYKRAGRACMPPALAR